MTTATLEPTTIRSPKLCRLTGVTYRMLDYWVRNGVLEPVTRGRGSGTVHVWALDHVHIAAALRVLADLHAQGPQLKAAVRALEQRPDLEAPGWLMVGTGARAVVVEDADPPLRLEAGAGAWVIRLPVALRGQL